MKLAPLERSIIKTLVYFDLLDYPLTATEVWKWLYRPEVPDDARTLFHVSDSLENSTRLQELVSRREGFYCLRGREDLIPERKRRNNRVDRQLRKTCRVVKLLRLFPSIRMIAIASSLSFGNVKETSDIDLFIVTKKNQIWMTRLFAAGSLKLLRQRPQPMPLPDRFCLSFFVSEDALNVEKAAFGSDDIVFQYYVQSFIPIYDPDGLYARFLKENAWYAKYLPNAYFEQGFLCEVGRPQWLVWWHRFFESISYPFFHGPLSDWYCNLQLKILPDRLKSIANIDSRVIISDQMLKFHDKDNRQELRHKWQERLAAYGS